MDNLSDKIALVTGGGSGICLAFVKLLHDAGCQVLIADLALTKDATEWMASASSGPKIEFQRTDVTRWKDLQGAFDACKQKLGSTPDIVVPGAGIFEPNAPSFWKDGESDEDSRYKVLDINLVHPIKTTRIAVREMVKAGKGGAIIYVSSIAGQRSSVITPLYTISKHGVNSLIRGMAPLEQLINIRVGGVAPGTVNTPLYEAEGARKLLDLSKDFLLPKEEVARAMFALLTDREYQSGTILEVCNVGRENWRRVNLLNDSGPTGPASQTSRKADAIKDLMQYLRPDDLGGAFNGVIATD